MSGVHHRGQFSAGQFVLDMSGTLVPQSMFEFLAKVHGFVSPRHPRYTVHMDGAL